MPFFLSHLDIIDAQKQAPLSPNCEFFLAIALIEDVLEDTNPQLSQPTIKKGSQAARLLLSQLQREFNITGELNDSDLPYFFIDPLTQRPWYVSVSHSSEQAAVLIAPTPSIGIDIEDKAIRQSVAQRYFSKAENAWLTQFNDKTQSIARHLLWVIKECAIKVQGNSQQQAYLFKGLSHNVLPILANIKLLTETHVENGFLQDFELATKIVPSMSNTPHMLNFAEHQQIIGYIEDKKCGFILYI